MTFTITVGWWLVPLVAGLVCFMCGWLALRDVKLAGLPVSGQMVLSVYLAATALTTMAWLVWALMR